jgi:NAD(P)-dependent dehydrogenase (short-subunit alcohol dehydrogenase family)
MYTGGTKWNLGLTNKVAIITGGSDGIGKAAAKCMAEEGAKVIIVARRADVLEAAAQSIQPRSGDGTVAALQGDATETATLDRIVQTARDRFDRIDILVNNAGVSMAKPFADVTDEDWEWPDAWPIVYADIHCQSCRHGHHQGDVQGPGQR